MQLSYAGERAERRKLLNKEGKKNEMNVKYLEQKQPRAGL